MELILSIASISFVVTTVIKDRKDYFKHYGK